MADIREQAIALLTKHNPNHFPNWHQAIRERTIDAVIEALMTPPFGGHLAKSPFSPRMTDDEILKRARRAASSVIGLPSLIGKIARGERDDHARVQACIAVLRDLDKPVEPTVDERLAEIARTWAHSTNQPIVEALKQAYEMGKSDV